jgi:hypothetical protein
MWSFGSDRALTQSSTQPSICLQRRTPTEKILLNSDLLEFLDALLGTEPRPTEDLDLWIDTTLENVERVYDEVPFSSLRDLIAVKRATARPQEPAGSGSGRLQLLRRELVARAERAVLADRRQTGTRAGSAVLGFGMAAGCTHSGFYRGDRDCHRLYFLTGVT